LEKLSRQQSAEERRLVATIGKQQTFANAFLASCSTIHSYLPRE
jgi:hypothetical protein